MPMSDAPCKVKPAPRPVWCREIRTRMRVLSAGIGALLAIDHAAAGGPGRGLPPRHFVTSCDDAGPGTLREVLAAASSGDSIDLYGLTCAKITLTTGELRTHLDDIDIGGFVEVSAGGGSRVLMHLGKGTLSILDLTISDGRHSEDWITAGGCIYSRGNIRAIEATIRNCTASSRPGPGGMVMGGGLFVGGNANLTSTRVVDNTIVSENAGDLARGGGIHARQLQLLHSTVSGNVIASAGADASTVKAGGGFYSSGSVNVSYSTISGNSADFGGGGRQSGGSTYPTDGLVSSIRNSTISGNTARLGAGGIVSSDDLLNIRNSTIAFNASDSATDLIPACGGVFFFGGDQYLSLRSSIVSNNVAAGVAADVCASEFVAPIIGYGNLVIAANRPLPPDTIRSDPMLEPLGYNGGRTLTHGVASTSPAIDAGNNSTWLNYDQRGFPRVVGDQADIGAFERQPDVIFLDGFD